MKLRYTKRAASELDAVLGHIDEQSPQGAAKVKRRMQAVIDVLLRYPEAGRMTSRAGLRRLVVHPYPYVVFYRVSSDAIIIHGVRHSARRPSSMPDQE